MTETDELRRLLDERGVEWKSITHDLQKTNPEQRDFRTVWKINGVQYEADEDMSVPKLHIRTYSFFTPEQAIAATLGSGTLTADDMRDLIERHSSWVIGNNRCFHNGAYEEIADELNATLGSDDGYEAKMDELLCRLTNGKWSKSRAYSIEFMVSCIDEEYEDAYEKERAELGSERGTCHAESDLSEWVCSRCQCWIPLGLTPENIKHASEWRYCPHCGAKVEVG